MIVKNSLGLAYKSFKKEKLVDDSTIFSIIKAFIYALFLSLPIYLYAFKIEDSLIHTIIVIVGFFLLLKSSRKEFVLSGFFISIFWFYWISLSFRYYNLTWMIPFVILSIGFIYLLIFWIVSFFDNAFTRVIAIFLIPFIHPFGFDWLDWRVLLLQTPFGLTYLHFLFLLIGISLIGQKHKKYIFTSSIFFILAIEWQTHKIKYPLLENVELNRTDIEQKNKYDHEKNLKMIFQEVENAIEKNKKIIIFPESALLLYLEEEPRIITKLLSYSDKITIVLGSLYRDFDNIYNSAYWFSEGSFTRADKKILVPFGEKIPIPKFASSFINYYMMNKGVDFSEANSTTDIKIDGKLIRSAICYEGTKKEFYQENPNYMFLLSNNSWFSPSIQPVLQERLLKLHSSIYNITIYHSTNKSRSMIIEPRDKGFFEKMINNYFFKDSNNSMASSFSQG